LVDLTAVAIALATLLLLTRLKRIPEPALIGAAGILGVLLTSQPPTVVFVCEHGSAKSLVAASLFQRMAKDRGLDARAISRGTAPDSSVPPAVVAALRADGFEVGSFRPQALNQADVAGAVQVVTIGVDLGPLGDQAAARVVHWDGVPPVSTNYPEARRDLITRIDKLLEELRPSGRATP
jgi:protein-tyrosine-phosphatase